MQNMCEHTEWVAHKVKNGCQMWKEEGETEIMVEEKKKKKEAYNTCCSQAVTHPSTE